MGGAARGYGARAERSSQEKPSQHSRFQLPPWLLPENTKRKKASAPHTPIVLTQSEIHATV